MKSFVDSVLRAAVVSLAIALPLAAAEPPYPSHPLRIIVPFAPGGASDVVGRLLAQKLGESMHLAAVLFQARTGVTLNHVPYKGGNAGPVALVANEIPVLFTTAGGSTTYVDSGRLRALAVTTKKRFVLWPDVPTIAESVAPGFDVLAWYAVAAPKNMPAALVNKLNSTLSEILKRPDVTEKLLVLGAETRATSPREAQDFLASEVARWTKVVRDEKIPPQD